MANPIFINKREEDLKALSKLYYEAGSPIAFAGIQTIYNYFKGRLKIREIKSFLETAESYSLHFPFKKAKVFNPTYVSAKRQSFQLDIIYMTEFAKQNDNYKYILCCVDVFSRYMWCEPLFTLKSAEVTKAFQSILSRSGKTVSRVTTDHGSEFIGKPFTNLLRGKKIKIYLSNGKCAIVERAQQTLKRGIYKYFTEFDNMRYIDKLDQFVETYNLHYHRFLKMSPKSAEKKENSDIVLNRHLQHFMKVERKAKESKLAIGDFVRISQIKSKFKRSFDQTAKYEIFKIVAKDTKLPVTRFEIQDENGEKIEGSFTQYELVKVHLKDYKVVVLKTRKRKNKTQYFVKYKGYPDSFNEWIDKSQLRKL